jgi:hypothetical protein
VLAKRSSLAMRSRLAPEKYLGQAFLQHRAELAPQAEVLLGLLACELLQQVERAARERRLQLLELARVLQQLAADVERQVVAVDHAAHEAQVVRQHVLGRVHDEDALDVEPQALALVALELEIERRLRRQEQQRGEVLVALDAVVGPGRGIAEIVADVLVERLVFLVADRGLGSRPQRRGLVRGFELVGRLAVLLDRHADREGDVVRVRPDQRAQLPAIEELVLAGLEVQHDLRAARGLRRRLQREAAVARRRPGPGFVAAGAAAGDAHLVGHHEGRIEADAELADQVGIGFLALFECFEELARAGARDGAEVLDQLRARHADAGIRHRQRACFLVPAHLDPQLGLVAVQRRVGERFEAELVAGIGGIRHQLAQEDVLVRIERMDHQPQHLLDFGLELEGFGRGRGHAPASKWKSMRGRWARRHENQGPRGGTRS